MQFRTIKTRLLVCTLVYVNQFQFSLQDPNCYISEVNTTTNESLCAKDYFIFPNIWHTSDLSREAQDETDNDKLTLCCPMGIGKTRVDDKQFWWPDEVHRGLSRAIINCHPTSIPGLETIRFFYYTNNNQDVDDYSELFIGSRKALRVSKFVKDAPLKIVIHGFMSSAFVGPAKALRQAYSQLPHKINFVAVHWEALANLVTASDSICYNIASESTKLVGKRTAELIEFLITEKLTSLDNVHILGHSLGAHCAGFAGKFLKSGKAARITGFDPARPNFEKVSNSERIDYTDAHFVDIIHTATKDWKLLGIVTLGLAPFPVGLQESLGHADFYPNRGSHQPGCKAAKLLIPVVCSHARSYLYYAESIEYFAGKKQFLSQECKEYSEVEAGLCSGSSTIAMGEYTPLINITRKIYLLATRKKAPFVWEGISYGMQLPVQDEEDEL